MNKILCVLVLLLASTGAFAGSTTSQGCPMASDEELICANVVCDFGLIMGEWSPECTQYKRRLAWYLAGLGFWDKPPKCKNRDQNCNKTGTAKKAAAPLSICVDPITNETDAACVKGANVNNSGCDDLEGAAQESCYLALAKNNNECSQLSGATRSNCLAAVTTVKNDTTIDPDTGAITETETGVNIYSGEVTSSITKVTLAAVDPDTGVSTTTVTTTNNLTGEVSTSSY